MLARAATRTTTSLVTKRGFHATRARLSSPYHYAEGPYTNIPFNPRSKWFGLGYWGFMATGFFAPFGIAGACFILSRTAQSLVARHGSCMEVLTFHSLPNLQGLSAQNRHRRWVVCFGCLSGSMGGGSCKICE
jgi:cytochrome c oxidase subunit 7c